MLPTYSDRVKEDAAFGLRSDGEQDLICVDPNSSGVIVTEDPQDTFIFNRSC